MEEANGLAGTLRISSRSKQSDNTFTILTAYCTYRYKTLHLGVRTLAGISRFGAVRVLLLECYSRGESCIGDLIGDTPRLHRYSLLTRCTGGSFSLGRIIEYE